MVINSSNQNVTWDDTGITITNKFNGADKTKIIAGGIFVTNDGGESWKNAISGNGFILARGSAENEYSPQTFEIQVYKSDDFLRVSFMYRGGSYAKPSEVFGNAVFY